MRAVHAIWLTLKILFWVLVLLLVLPFAALWGLGHYLAYRWSMRRALLRCGVPPEVIRALHSHAA